MNALYALYCLICPALVFLVYRTEALDFRGVGRLSRQARTPRLGATEEDDYADPAETAQQMRGLARQLRRLSRLEVAPRADFQLLLTLAGAGALLTGGALGFLIPLGMEAIGGGAEPLPGAPALQGPMTLGTLSYAADYPLARLAQSVGAACGAIIALRMLRVFMGVAVFLAAILLLLIAANFVIGRPALALFGA